MMADSELILALGKNLGIGSNKKDIRRSPDSLSPESRITADAAALLYIARRGMADVLLCGGHTAGLDRMAESVAMKARMLKYFEISPGHIFTDRVSYDTRTNVSESLKWLADRPQYTKIDLLSVSFHADNAARLMRMHSLPIDEVFYSDDILSERSMEDALSIAAWRDSPRIRAEFFKEGIRSLMLSSIDPTGEKLQAVAELVRT